MTEEQLDSWRELMMDTLKSTKERFEDLTWAIEEDGIDKRFYSGFGSAEGVPFTAWGPKYVYFPLEYDGSERVGYAPRNPCDERMDHQ